MIPTVFRNGLVFTQNDKREVVQADVLVRHGRIEAIGPSLPVTSAAQVIDATGQWIIPGFVQAHMHLTQMICRGLADDRELLPWLRDRIWPLEAAHTYDTNRVSAELGISELLLSGTTTILDMGTSHHHDAVFAAATEMGIRYYGGKALMDVGPDAPPHILQDSKTALKECETQKQRWHQSSGGRVQFVYAPRFILSCTGPLLRAVGERSRADGILIHTHASENRGEVEAVRAITGDTNLRALDKVGCLHSGTVIAHGVHVSGDEETCLVTSGAAVCHCPGSNLKLASGIADVPRLLSRGVRVGLGADGAACDNTIDQRFELRLAALLPRLSGGPTVMSAQTAFDLATIGGARALGAERDIGSIEVGKRADLVCLRPRMAPIVDPVSALVFGATATTIESVMVDGVMRVSEGTLAEGSFEATLDRAQAAQNSIRKRAGV